MVNVTLAGLHRSVSAARRTRTTGRDLHAQARRSRSTARCATPRPTSASRTPRSSSARSTRRRATSRSGPPPGQVRSGSTRGDLSVNFPVAADAYKIRHHRRRLRAVRLAGLPPRREGGHRLRHQARPGPALGAARHGTPPRRQAARRGPRLQHPAQRRSEPQDGAVNSRRRRPRDPHRPRRHASRSRRTRSRGWS